jgi:hypothetical protein
MVAMDVLRTGNGKFSITLGSRAVNQNQSQKHIPLRSRIMKRANEFKGYTAFTDDDGDMVSFVSGRLSGAFGFGEELQDPQEPRTAAEAQRRSDLRSLLLMASLMLGGSAVNSA